jgi:hypothetical protein
MLGHTGNPARVEPLAPRDSPEGSMHPPHTRLSPQSRNPAIPRGLSTTKPIIPEPRTFHPLPLNSQETRLVACPPNHMHC